VLQRDLVVRQHILRRHPTPGGHLAGPAGHRNLQPPDLMRKHQSCANLDLRIIWPFQDSTSFPG